MYTLLVAFSQQESWWLLRSGKKERERDGGEGRKRWWDLGLGRGRGGWGGSAAEATEVQAGMLPRQVANVLLYLLYFILLL